jgi:O-antigen ligase
MISADEPLGPLGGIRSSGRRKSGHVVWGASLAALSGAIVAYLVSTGLWYLLLGLLLVAGAFVLLLRYPLAAIAIWLLVAPFVVETDSDALRRVFWLVHRALPVAMVAVILLGALLGIRARRLPALGWPELMMAGYVIASLVSIVYTSNDVLATSYLLYDRVFIPMCLYTIVRLLEPDETQLRRLLPAVVFLLASQSVIGLLSWVAPEVLPSVWLGKLGERTTGSLRDPNTFGTSMLFCGVFVLHSGLMARRGWVRSVGSVSLFVLAMCMAFLTLSRAVWLAGLIAILGSLFIYRRFVKRILAFPAAAVIAMLALGLLTEPVELARYRIWSEESEESALSRLPVVYASVRMSEARPVVGWGYGNFDRFDRQFQRPVGNLVYPGKDHASHNLFLTILAEQGILGFTLFLGPTLYWLFRTRSGLARMPAERFINGSFVKAMWLVVGGFFVVNSFMVMHVPFGLGLWWLTLGLIGSVVDRYQQRSERIRGRSTAGFVQAGIGGDGTPP